MIRWTPPTPASPPQRWQSRAERVKTYLDSLSPDELLRIRPHYWALRFGPAAYASPFSKALHTSHYDPDQPRVPAGNPDGGQWTDEGGSSSESFLPGLADPELLGTQFAADGHHYVARGVFQKEKYSFHQETLQVFVD